MKFVTIHEARTLSGTGVRLRWCTPPLILTTSAVRTARRVFFAANALSSSTTWVLQRWTNYINME